MNLLPWQKEPKADYGEWTITGGRGVGKSTALSIALVERAAEGEDCMLVVPNSPTGHLSRLAELVSDHLSLDPAEDYRVSHAASMIHFRSGGLIRVMLPWQPGERGRQWPSTSVGVDVVDKGHALLRPNTPQVRRLMTVFDGKNVDGVPVVNVIPRDAGA